MGRREFLRIGASGLAVGVAGVWPEVTAGDQVRSSIGIDATLQAGAFASSTGDDARYHALVYEGGGAAPKSLLTTPVSDREIAARLREMGAVDGGGVPMAAWTFREIPLVPWPNARVRGTPMTIRVEWEGWDGPRGLGDLLNDPGEQGVSFRFGGNEEHDEAWDSGCVACLYSCPGGVVSNERYTIRDRFREATRFVPVDDLPPDGTRVVVTLELLPA